MAGLLGYKTYLFPGRFRFLIAKVLQTTILHPIPLLAFISHLKMYSDEEDYGHSPMEAAPEEDLSIDSPPPSDEGDIEGFAEDEYGQHDDTYSDDPSNKSYKQTISEQVSDVEDNHYPSPTFMQGSIQPTDRFHAAQVALDDAERNARPTKVEERMDKLGKFNPLVVVRQLM